MKDCCGPNEQMHEDQARVLKIVFLINALMFVFEFSMGLISHSTSLLSDSLDMFGDALVYGLSLYVLHRNDRWKAGVAFAKGLLICMAGVVIIVEAIYKSFTNIVPTAQIIGWVGLCAFIANGVSLLLIRKYKDGDLNMRSSYICSRNDMISNVGVLIVAGVVGLTQSKWPDIIFGSIVVVLFFRSAWPILKESFKQFRRKS